MTLSHKGSRRKKWPLETEACWWFLASTLDFIMTYILLLRPGFAESNPIALRFYHDYGPKGLLGFKLAMTLFVILICEIISRTRLDLARRVLQIGTLIVGIVVAYSAMMYARGGPLF
jgi:hypothetical protein